ncbi:MAG: hypothetical protein IK031_06825 [Bacteroidales bacterium]|nr:hypothetical protein [Bacteroidales bacterium]
MKFKRFCWTVLALLASGGSICAQDLTVSFKADSTFNAAISEAQTFKGFDVDTSKVNVVNIAMQLAQDVAFAVTNDDGVTGSLPNPTYYRQRADLVFSAALPERTNAYFTVSFLDNEPGVKNDASVVVTNLEVEHYFRNNLKIRVGRLGNTVSESQFFGRIALEESSAHVYGRKIFINDAIEFDGSFSKKGGPVFFIGLKPDFKPLDFKAAYAGIHQEFKSGLQMHSIVSYNRQFEKDMTSFIPDFTGTDSYFSYEAEVAYKRPAITVFANAGGNLGFRGQIPHATGPFDIVKQIPVVVTDKADAFKETFLASTGFRLFPSKLNPANPFKQIGIEAEVQGAFSDRYTATTVCAYFKLGLTKRLVLTYYCTPEFIWQNINADKPEFIAGVVNFLRLSLTVGQPARMFM